MPNIKNNAAAQQTCRRLIDAAGEVFAERGLHAATIKQITDRAGVNVAAVNYHFSDKFELYAAVVRYALMLKPEPTPASPGGSAEDRLRAEVASMIDDRYDGSRPAWRAPLLAHEFAQPTAALDAVMEELIRPRADHLEQIVRQFLGSGATDQEVVRGALSIAGQCFFYLYDDEVIRRLHPDLDCENHREQLVEHIVLFSLAGLRAMRRRRPPRPRRR